MALTKTTSSMILGDHINVLDYMTQAQSTDCLSPTGGTIDVTSAVQNAIDASYSSNSGNNNIVFFPAGRYLITSTINLHPGTKLQGVNIDAGGASGTQSFPNEISDSKGTVILFKPSTQQSLFVPILPKGGSLAWGGIGIEGLNIWGNTSKADYFRTAFGDTGSVVETSLYAFDFADVQMSSVRNVGVMGFMSAIRERDRCQNNNYDNIYIQYCREAAILFSESTTGVEITDSRFTNVRVWSCLHAIQMVNTTGAVDPLQVRFEGCFFASFASHAFIVASGAKETMFLDCYCEGVGLDTSITDTATFLITGARAQQSIPNLNVIGGQYAGATGGITPTNAIFLDTDICGGVNLIAVSAKRYATGVVCTANTRNRSIYLANPFFDSVTTALFDSSSVGKIIGTYRIVRSDGANDDVVVNTEFITWSGDLQITAPTIRLGNGSSASIRPGGDNTMSCGRADTRWSEVFAAAPSINTSDEREKTFLTIEDVERAAALEIKANLRKFKFNSAIEKKGNDARIHFGVAAQQVGSIMQSHGLDPTKYAFFCYDEWEQEVDAGGNVTKEVGNRYGIRYEELLCFIMAAI